MIDVYRINTLDTKTNKYSIGREQHWIVRKDKEFNDEKSAKLYVVEKSKIFTDCIALLGSKSMKLDQTKKNEYYNDFCFNDEKYLLYRRFFLGYPPINEIKRLLRTNGIQTY